MQNKRSLNLHSKAIAPWGVAKTDEGGRWIFLGILSLFDPPRDDAAAMIQKAKQHGINIKMVTGDNIAIAKQTCWRAWFGTKYSTG